MFTNVTYYLKYRPQSLDELIGQETVKRTLLSSFQNNKLSHAYLFVGPRGTGKTSTARILAKMVNCENPDKIPCNSCATCISITDGSNLDLIEIDAASNRGIEDIRSLRDKIKLVPTNAKKKVYIIDEVHMLTTEAFNALLKTLEEPPAHALFILATTENSKIPKTILSRVQRLDFKLATTEELSEALKKIIKVEKIDIEEEALKILIKKSDGSFRDGVKLLDQVSSGEKVTVELVSESLKSSRFENILELVKNLKDKNANLGLLNITKQIENGADVKELFFSLMEYLRGLIFIKNGVGKQLVEPQFTEDKYQQLVEVSENFLNQELINDLEILQGALEKLKFTSIPSLPLELAIIEICTASSAFVSASMNFVPKGVEELSVSSAKQPSPADYPVEVTSLPTIPHNDDVVSIPVERISASIIESRIIREVKEGKSISADSPDIQKLKEKWTFVLETVRQINFSLEALLRCINITECTESSVVMEVPYSFHQRILEAPKNRDLLEGVFSDILGRSIRISIILGSRPVRKDDVANVEVAEDDEIIRAAAEIFNSDSVN